MLLTALSFWLPPLIIKGSVYLYFLVMKCNHTTSYIARENLRETQILEGVHAEAVMDTFGKGGEEAVQVKRRRS